MLDTSRLEVLAPAGDLERFNAALDFGADAIYLGGHSFGMRAVITSYSIHYTKLYEIILNGQKAIKKDLGLFTLILRQKSEF